jgi:hypothetical protein
MLREDIYERALVKEGSLEGEYGWCTLYARMNIESFKPVETTLGKGQREKEEK